MASISQGIVLTTAMVLSSTVLYLAFSRHKTTPPFKIHGDSNSRESNIRIVRSCLYSEEKKRKRKKNNKKKRVQFAENVKEEGLRKSKELKEEQRKQNRLSLSKGRHENPETGGMPANRIALYNGILRDRVHRMECSY